jgi:hypothetical protein
MTAMNDGGSSFAALCLMLICSIGIMSGSIGYFFHVANKINDARRKRETEAVRAEIKKGNDRAIG